MNKVERKWTERASGVETLGSAYKPLTSNFTLTWLVGPGKGESRGNEGRFHYF